ncbi:MAG: CopG family transcriptional regulator [Leptospiraceae bacterium]|nr:CopG family transcriptional regulator [Leptospiraceae bacterium]MCP5511337.1 CopG family transcriptional regulator [Leptospiraceae bacterium]
MKKSNSKNKIKRFQILLPENDFNLMKKEASKRNISSAEMIRISLNNEIIKRTNLDRIQAFKDLLKLGNI